VTDDIDYGLTDLGEKTLERKRSEWNKNSGCVTFISGATLFLSLVIIVIGHVPFGYLFMGATLCISLLILLSTFKAIRNKSARVEHFTIEHREFIGAVLVICFGFALAFFVLLLRDINPSTIQLIKVGANPNGDFFEVRIEWFIWLTFCLGVIGALWAIAAKMKADEAFFASSAAYSKARETLLSFGGSLNFDDIMNEKSVRMLPAMIRNAKTELIILISIPLVGFFKSNEMGKKFINILIQKLEEIAEGGYKEFDKIILLYFDDDVSKKYIQSWKTKEDNKIKASSDSDEKKQRDMANIQEAYVQFIEKLDLLTKLVNRIDRDKNEGRVDKDRISIIRYKVDIRVRFVISKAGMNQRALVWVVSDFELDGENDGDLSKFESAGFSTQDELIINVLQKLADDYKKILPKFTK